MIPLLGSPGDPKEAASGIETGGVPTTPSNKCSNFYRSILDFPWMHEDFPMKLLHSMEGFVGSPVCVIIFLLKAALGVITGGRDGPDLEFPREHYHRV